MPRAVGPIFVAAILLLIGGGIVAGLRVTGDGEPAAQAPETEAPGGVDVTTTESPLEDEPTMESPTPTLSPTPTTSPSPGDSPTEPSPDAAGDDGDDRDGGDGVSEDAGGDAEGDEPQPSETRSPSDDETVLAIDDMPDTGGGAATIGVAAILVGAVAAGMRRR